MMTIDSQVHCYEHDHPGRPWVSGLTGPPHVTGDEMVAAMDAVGVDGALLVSPFAMYRYDASYAITCYAAHPTRYRLIKPVDPNDPAVSETIAEWAAIKVRRRPHHDARRCVRPTPLSRASIGCSPPARGMACRST